MACTEERVRKGTKASSQTNYVQKQTVQLDYFADTKVHGRPIYSRVGLIGAAARGVMPILYGHDVQQAVEDAVIVAEAVAGGSM